MRFKVPRIKADAAIDATAAIQTAMDRQAPRGGKVLLEPGMYRVKGSLVVPAGVTLEGSTSAPRYNHPLTGTIILATGGRDREDAPALFEMGNSTAVRNLTVYYPEQKADNIRPYAWTFHLAHNDNTVENITLINSYNAIRVGDGPAWNVR